MRIQLMNEQGLDQAQNRIELHLICDKSISPLYHTAKQRVYTLQLKDLPELVRIAAGQDKEKLLYQRCLQRHDWLDIWDCRLFPGAECFFILSKETWVYGHCREGELGVSQKQALIRLPLALAPYCKQEHLFRAISSSFTHSLALTHSKQIFVWGRTSGGAIGQDFLDQTLVVPIRLPMGPISEKLAAIQGGQGGKLPQLTSIKAGRNISLFAYGQIVLVCGTQLNSRLGVQPGLLKINVPHPIPYIFDSNVQEIGVGEDFVIALTKEGLVYGWGSNSKGRLGLQTLTECNVHQPTPLRFLLPTRIAKLACSSSATVCICEQGKLIQWGMLIKSQLDDIRPRRVLSQQNFKSITAGDSHFAALASNGQLYFHGVNNGAIPIAGRQTSSWEKLQFRGKIAQVITGSNYTAFISGPQNITNYQAEKQSLKLQQVQFKSITPALDIEMKLKTASRFVLGVGSVNIPKIQFVCQGDCDYDPSLLLKESVVSVSRKSSHLRTRQSTQFLHKLSPQLEVKPFLKSLEKVAGPRRKLPRKIARSVHDKSEMQSLSTMKSIERRMSVLDLSMKRVENEVKSWNNLFQGDKLRMRTGHPWTDFNLKNQRPTKKKIVTLKKRARTKSKTYISQSQANFESVRVMVFTFKLLNFMWSSQTAAAKEQSRRESLRRIRGVELLFRTFTRYKLAWAVKRQVSLSEMSLSETIARLHLRKRMRLSALKVLNNFNKSATLMQRFTRQYIPVRRCMIKVLEAGLDREAVRQIKFNRNRKNESEIFQYKKIVRKFIFLEGLESRSFNFEIGSPSTLPCQFEIEFLPLTLHKSLITPLLTSKQLKRLSELEEEEYLAKDRRVREEVLSQALRKVFSAYSNRSIVFRQERQAFVDKHKEKIEKKQVRMMLELPSFVIPLLKESETGVPFPGLANKLAKDIPGYPTPPQLCIDLDTKPITALLVQAFKKYLKNFARALEDKQKT